MENRSQIPFDLVKEVGLSLPDVEASTKYDGSPVLKLGGAFLAGLATHPSAEPDTLIIRSSLEDRERLMEEAPSTYYLTDHYRKHLVILVRLRGLDRNMIRELLSMSSRLTPVNVRASPRRS